MNSYKHVIWDWNGTLLNDALLCIEVLNGLLKSRGLESVSEEFYRKHFGFPVIEFYEFLGLETDPEGFDLLSREFIGTYEMRWLQECSLFPGTIETLVALAECGMTHSVLSAAKQEALHTGVTHYGLLEHFTELVGADNIHARGKKERALEWMTEFHWPPEEVVLIGDTLHDLEVAQAIEVDCILVAHGHHTPERLIASGRPVAHSMAEVVDFLK